MTTPEQLVTDGGLETDLIFNHGIDLPDFAAFPLLGRGARPGPARPTTTRSTPRSPPTAGAGLVLETPTWRANTDWAAVWGTTPPRWPRSNRDAVGFLRERRGPLGRPGAGHPRQRPDRPARRRLPARCRGRPGRGGGLPPPADRRVRRGRRGRDHGPDADRRRRGARHRRGGEGRGSAGGDLVHGRDRRPAARRHHAGRGDRHRRRGRRAGVLPGQLRAPRAHRARAGGGRSVARAHPRPAGERLDDEPRGAGRRRPSSTPATRRHWPPRTAGSSGRCRPSGSSAAAAAPTRGTWRPSGGTASSPPRPTPSMSR